MPNRLVLFHYLAAREYRSAVRWYAQRSPAAAQRFHQAIDRVIERLQDNAEQGALLTEPFRWMKPQRFPYILYYEIFSPGLVWVYAVAHARRRPGYWQRRKKS
jgi:plasmid stabilization system protein ParE